MTPPPRPEGLSPFDTPASSASRFLIEIVAWVAGPWAAADITNAWWMAIPTAAVLFALPAVFNTPGDKNTTGVATPGAVRIAIEMLLLVVAVGAAFVVWPVWAGVIVAVAGVAMVAAGIPRYRWLLAQPNPWARDAVDGGRSST